MHTLMLALAAMALAASPALAADARQQERDKKTVVDFYEKALNQKDVDAAAKYLGPRYTQHNPNAADGPEGLRVADGDYVILHVHVVQPIPEKAANANGMF
jgi:predicted SnoaL-like aldol condensation-catalyzing enzyme